MCDDKCVDITKPSCCGCCNKDLCYETCWGEEFFEGQHFVAEVKEVDYQPFVSPQAMQLASGRLW